MRTPPLSALLALLLAIAPAAYGADAAPAVSPGSVLQMVMGLVVVVALMGGTAWLLKRSGVSGAGGNNVAKVIGGVSVGNRERVLVIEVADQWIVVGVAQGRVSALTTMPRQEHPASGQPPLPNNFAGWLKQTIDKRNGK
jgi:flagellar protein FliO/FliZ